MGQAAPGTETVAPGGGTLLQEQKPAMPPAGPQGPLDLDFGQPARPAAASTAPFEVRDFRLTGNTVFATSELQKLLADSRNREFTLPELTARVARISDFYHARGYPLARALIPAQTLRDGVVEVAIVEARYGAIGLVNRARVNTALLESMLAPLETGQLVRQLPLEHVLLLMADVPGAAPNATLQPGKESGTSDIEIRESSTAPINAQATMDNEGNRFTGRLQGGGEVAWYGPLQHGDAVDASLLTSGNGLQYGRLSYETLLDGAGTHLGVAYSTLHYRLGDGLQALGGHGTAQVASLWTRRALLRSREANLYLQFGYDHKPLRDDLDNAALRTHRHLDDAVAVLSGDWEDAGFSGGINSWSVQWTSGGVHFDDQQAQHGDALTSRTRGGFSQWNAVIARTQRLGVRDALYLTLAGQAADGNLDPAQKLTAGGRYSVRAYDTSVLSGDGGAQAGLELRHTLRAQRNGQWQALGFLEAQHVTVNRRPWTEGTNDATLGGGGLGLAWTRADRWSAKAFVAARLGAVPALIGDASRLRGWVEISKGFQ